MTGPPNQADRNDPGDFSQYKYFKAVNNKHGVRQDLEALCKFVRETLFYAMIHELEDREQTQMMRSWEKMERQAKFLSMFSSETRRKYPMLNWLKVRRKKRNNIWNSCGKRGYELRVGTTSGKPWAMKSRLYMQEFVKALRVSGCQQDMGFVYQNVNLKLFQRTSTWLFCE